MYVGDKGVIITDGGGSFPQIIPRNSFETIFINPPVGTDFSERKVTSRLGDAIKNGGQIPVPFLIYGKSAYRKLTLLGVMSSSPEWARIPVGCQKRKSSGLAGNQNHR